MRRYGLWVLALVFGMLGVGLSVQAQDAAPAAVRTLSIATLAPQGSTWMRVFDAWNREIRRRSNKTLQLRFYPSGVQGDEAEVIRKIRSGRLDGGAVTGVGLSQVYRPALVFQLPGIFRSYEQLDNARNALNGELNTAFQGAGFELMGWGDVGWSRVFSSNPVRTPAELAAQHNFVWREDLISPVLFQTIHANPIPLQIPEVLSALQTNRINCVIASSVVCVSLQWASRLSHMTDDNGAMLIGATIFGHNQFATLTPEQQTILRETAVQFHALARRNLRNDETAALSTLTQHGITAVPVDEAARQQWAQVFTQVRQRVTGQIADAAFINRVAQLAH